MSVSARRVARKVTSGELCILMRRLKTEKPGQRHLCRVDGERARIAGQMEMDTTILESVLVTCIE